MKTNHQELLHQLFQLTWMLRRYTMHHQRDRGPAASPFQGQGRILALLRLKPEISQKELSTILDIRSQSLGELLAKLEKAGYITRTPSETDKRAMDVRLTDAGKTASEEETSDEEKSFFNALTDDEQASFADYIDRLITSLETELGAGGERGEPGARFGFGPDFRQGGPAHRGPHHGHGGFDHFFGRGPHRGPHHEE